RARQTTPAGAAPAGGATVLAAGNAAAPAAVQPPGQVQMPPAELPSAVAEREANELLARGDSAAATAKFTESERLRAQEQRLPGGESTSVAMAAAKATADPSIQRVDG